jgi:signal transduction histidine kinase
VAVSKLWGVSGEQTALEFVGEINRSKAQMNIRFIWLDAESGSPYRPELSRKLLEPLFQDQPVNRVDRERKGVGYMYTYMPVHVGGDRLAALELVEPLTDERHYVWTTIFRIFVTTGINAAVFWLIAMALGVWLVGKPMGMLVDKARRVGAGDLSGPLKLQQRDEFAELAEELNAMCDRLAEANQRVAAETSARIATLEQLRHADRLMTVGKLASGIAHELGTPLNVVQARAKMIVEGEAEGPDTVQFARIIVEQCERMTRIIRQLLDFARPRSPRMATVDLYHVVRQTLTLLSPIAEKQRVELRAGGDGAPVLAEVDADQLQQVLSNLVLNGIQAMPGGGVLSVGIERRHVVPAPGLDLPEGEYLCIDVRDQGCGIPPEHLTHLFEPFFTTKQVGEGTGLGLPVSIGILREHHGWIDVESEVGAGSCFHIYLPQGSGGVPG